LAAATEGDGSQAPIDGKSRLASMDGPRGAYSFNYRERSGKENPSAFNEMDATVIGLR